MTIHIVWPSKLLVNVWRRSFSGHESGRWGALPCCSHAVGRPLSAAGRRLFIRKEVMQYKGDRGRDVAQETSTRAELNQRKMTGSAPAAAPMSILTFSSATGNVASMANIETTSIAMNTNQAPL